MSISFESAVATLKSMFPEWDEETLSTILMSNNYHVEQTIETVLSMGDSFDGESQSRAATSPSPQSPYGAPLPAPSARQQSPPVQRPAPQSQYSSSVPSSSGNRGLRCDLPDDFLRPPSWQSKNNSAVLADEELALMLQNELFQNEARRVLGDDFLRDTYGDSAGAGGTAPPPGRGSSRVQPAGANQPHHEAGADLGIMRALNSMGSAAKRNLTQLAQGFNSNGRSQGSSGGNTTNSNRRRGSGGGSRRKGAFNDLEDDDEEGTEIITFSSGDGRSQHILQGGGSNSGAAPASADGGDEDDDFDSANPLLASRGTHQI